MRITRGRFALFLAALALAGSPGFAQQKKKGADLVLQDKYPPVPQEHRDLKDVPFEPGAPAVLLLNAQQNDVLLETDTVRQRVNVYRRVKILTPAGAEDHGDYEIGFFGRWRLQKAEARTILPDGREIDATSAIQREQSKGATHDTETNELRIAWPQVQPGAILDLHYSYVTEGIPSENLHLQSDLPTLDSRLILQVPGELVFSTLGVLMAPAETQPQSFKSARGTTHVWQWTNLPSVGREPFSPPPDEASKNFIVYPREFRSGNFSYQWATDWKVWVKEEKDDLENGWDVWLKRKHNAVEALAKEVTAGKTTPVEKAEAIRQALRPRLRVAVRDYGRSAPSPDDVLSAGLGYPVEIVATAVAMLRSVEVPADIVVHRLRRSGVLPTQAPLPELLDGALVRFAGDKGPIYFDPIGDTAVGPTPPEAKGTFVMPLDGATPAPIKLPDVGVSDNRTVRVVKAKLDAAGNLEAEGTFSYFGLAAQRWRRAFEARDEAGRKELVRDRLRDTLPGAEVASLSAEGLDGDKEVKLAVSFRVEGYAAPAGNRMLVNANLFHRLDPADWAAETRTSDIWFGDPFDIQDTVSVQLPDGVVDVTVPATLNAPAPPIGRYASVHTRGGPLVSLRRQFRIDMGRVPVAAYATLKNWLRDASKQDEQPIVVTLP